MWIAFLLACTNNAADPSAAFPDGFKFGSAVAGFQVDPGCPTLPRETCEDDASDWYQWVTDEELQEEYSLYISGEPLSNGPGHYELYPQDLARASAQLHTSAFRFSIEWSRIFPDGAAEAASDVDALSQFADPEAVEWYHDYLDLMVGMGLEPVVTLNHYTLPLWVHDGKECHSDPETCTASGWLDADRIVPLIALYSEFCAREFGDDVTWWLTLNEPMGVVLPGFAFQDSSRSNPPGLANVELALSVFEAMAKAHGAMADAVHAADPDAKVGVVANIPVPEPADPSDPLDVQGAEHMDYFYNTMYLEAFINGRFDDDLDGEADRTDDTIAGRTDFIGLNHYNVVPVVGFEEPLALFGSYPVLDFLPEAIDSLSELGSFGIDEAIDRVEPYDMPIWITENGALNPTGATVEEWMRPNLTMVQERAQTTDIRGYLYWSLIDNYEWNVGMEWQFGLYEVDIETKERTIRDIGVFYSEVARTNAIPE